MSGKTRIIRELSYTAQNIQENIDLSGLPNGVYFVLLEKIGKTLSQRIVLNQ
jgi:hypothetical protein